MNNITLIDIDSFGEINTYVYITNEDGTWQSMLKSVYEEKMGPIVNE